MKVWKETLLIDVTSKIGDGLHGTPKYDNQGEYYFINGNNLIDGKIVIKPETKKVSKSEFLKHQKSLSSNTILLGINGTFGNVAIYNNEKCVLGKSACYINVNEKVDKRFLYYNFLNKDFQLFLESIATGTTIPNVPLKGLREYSFFLPDLPEQHSIASVLSSLDDKIDLLHRQNKTLEQMAETLFRQWFVEEAKDEWESGCLSDLVIVKYGKDHKSLEDGVIPAFGSGGVMRYVSKSLYEKESVLIPRKGTLSNLFWVDYPFWTVDTMFYTEMKQDYIAKFIYLHLKEQDLASMNVGSAVPSMTTEILNNLPITIPSTQLLRRFDEEVGLLYNKTSFNKKQISKLESIRDLLLPKLMNGAIRVIKH